MKFLFLFLVLFTSATTFASENVWVISNATAKQKFATIYKEQGKVFVDIFEKNAGELQDRLSQNTFTSIQLAEQFLKNMGAVPNDSLMKLYKDDISPVSAKIDGQVWVTTQQWTWDWELKYSAWVENSVNETFHERYNIATDCADVAISLRWIFARMNGLPAANSLSATGSLVTNESVKDDWSKLPTSDNWYDDQRFRAALEYVLDNAYTHTLIEDSYPIAVNPQSLIAGAHHLNLYSDETGHTMVVNTVDAVLGSIQMIYSSTPREVRELWSEEFDQYDQYDGIERGGLLRMRWPQKVNGVWVLRARTDMPTYSLEQYTQAFMGNNDYFTDAVAAHMGFNIDPIQKFKNAANGFKSRILDRIKIVQDGYTYCKTHSCAEGTEGWEDWSTPHRDERITEYADMLDTLQSNASNGQRAAMVSYWRTINNTPLNLGYITTTFDAAKTAFENYSYSSDPTAEIANRWGI